MAEKKTKNDVSKLNFEDSIKRLKAIVEQIEQGEILLQDSLEQYEQGMALIKHCRGILQQAEKRIEKISKTDQDEPKPADEEADAEAEAEGEAEDEALF
ncbi:MAG: exodeoxyribonuclease VII small subunit [Phycisphaerales bacterium]|nr:MAG: exodeoxyribonuclease VII small subunit [Phycisphaerales bacterium]